MIIKPKYTKNYTILPNELLNCKELSDKAFRLACYLLSLPSNWEVNSSHLAKVNACSTRYIRACIKELIDLGFLQKLQQVDEKSGRFLKQCTYVFVNNDEEETSKEIDLTLQNEIDLEVKEELNKSKIAQKIKEIKDMDKQDLQEDKKDESVNLNGLLDEKLLKDTDFKHFKDAEVKPPCGPSSDIINKEFLQSKNSFLTDFKKGFFSKNAYLFKTFDKACLFIYEKKNVKPLKLDFSNLNDFEISKINEFFEYKQKSKKRLLHISKQKIINQCKSFKLEGQNIGLIIDKSIRNGWAGLFALKNDFRNKKADELKQKEILRLVLEQEPSFDFSKDYDLSKVSLNGKKVSYDESKDEFKVF